MDDALKYIVIRGTYGSEQVIVFPGSLGHDEVAGKHEVISAGFCRLPDDLNKNVQVYGKSKTLDISSRDEDALLIEVQYQLLK